MNTISRTSLILPCWLVFAAWVVTPTDPPEMR